MLICLLMLIHWAPGTPVGIGSPLAGNEFQEFRRQLELRGSGGQEMEQERRRVEASVISRNKGTEWICTPIEDQWN